MLGGCETPRGGLTAVPKIVKVATTKPLVIMLKMWVDVVSVWVPPRFLRYSSEVVIAVPCCLSTKVSAIFPAVCSGLTFRLN